MTQEEKELVIKDLCGRLPYRLIIKCNDGFRQSKEKLVSIDVGNELINYDWLLTDIKPYLRPMSSMTEKEEEEWWDIFSEEHTVTEEHHKSIDWLNAHHFDYRGLIPKGLAKVAPEGMYNN